MGHIDVSGIEFTLSDGRVLLNDVSFRVGDGQKAALIGPNGAGKTTLIRMICGDVEPEAGAISISGGLGVMRQFIGQVRDATTVRELLLSVSPEKVRMAAAKLKVAEAALNSEHGEREQMAYATALSDWGDAGGYDAEVVWDICCTEALGKTLDEVGDREVNTLSGGEQKKLVLQALLRGPEEVLILDEPDNYLDVPSKRWLEEQLKESHKTILFISHDRELLASVANRIITLEQGVSGNTAKGSPDMASKYRAMQTRLRKFEEIGPPPAPPIEQDVKVGLTGGRTGERVITCEDLAINDLTEPFTIEIFYGDRVAILGKNGTGKSHFLRLLGGDEGLAVEGSWKLGARVKPGYFAQTHAHPEFIGKTLLEILWSEHSLQLGPAKSVLGRYELDQQAEQKFQTLSGGQQARFQILLLELQGSTLLLLDEPTDNLDLASAEALEKALGAYQGTVLAVTHDRWFTRGFSRYLVFGGDRKVFESNEPVWEY